MIVCPFCDCRLPPEPWRGAYRCDGCGRSFTQEDAERASTRLSVPSLASGYQQAVEGPDVSRAGQAGGKAVILGEG